MPEEEAVRQSEAVAEAGLRQRRVHARFEPNLSFVPRGLGDQVGIVEAITVARGIQLPNELLEVGRLTHATGGFEDVRENRTARVPAKAAVPAEALQLELLAGLPGVDPRVTVPSGIPFVTADAARAEAIVAHYMQQVQSEEVGAQKKLAAAEVSRAQEQSEEVSRTRSISTAAEFANVRQQAAALTILTSLGIGMAGLERANFLGTQGQHGGGQPVRDTTSGRKEVRTGSTGQLGRQTRIGVSSGSGDFRNFGTSIRGIGAIDRRFDTAVR